VPEGHTLRRLALDLTEAFAGERVAVGSPQGRFAADAAMVDGTVLEAADAAGKHLFLELGADRIIHIHLGLIGKLDITPGPAALPRGEVRLRVAYDGSGRKPAAYADLRGATRCDLIGPERRDQVIASLGPDPLRPDADPDKAWARISRSERSIGDLLMDQCVLAGVGNVYRAEVLFRHRIDPQRPGRSLRTSQWQAIWDDLTDLMAAGVSVNRIDTVRPEHTPEAMGREPRVDDHGGEVYVYRRASQPCLVCGTTVRTTVLKGRNLFWCPRCQPRYRSRALG
jgi:endonuclease-8